MTPNDVAARNTFATRERLRRVAVELPDWFWRSHAYGFERDYGIFSGPTRRKARYSARTRFKITEIVNSIFDQCSRPDR
ncbi:hypothetical protein [Amycolatopsis lurida]|uniref:hypothetical protein n=1 Tax=Amycolatopsis lurida TaxID=31959 RepID=UPI00365A3ACD